MHRALIKLRICSRCWPSARLQLPEQLLHILTWRQAGCLTFHLQLSHVLRVGHLQPLKAWRSLLYPLPARLPMC